LLYSQIVYQIEKQIYLNLLKIKQFIQIRAKGNFKEIVFRSSFSDFNNLVILIIYIANHYYPDCTLMN